ncbi:hypothetical protein GCM10009839_08290 [Catenulispora yoronensis]|uniref:Methylamine utilisation protein MauE domain-containing protein n=1 Tax=Catenulispora yoronensis TaxID=450799 RepID=A0ABN2TPX7_9ACTN
MSEICLVARWLAVLVFVASAVAKASAFGAFRVELPHLIPRLSRPSRRVRPSRRSGPVVTGLAAFVVAAEGATAALMAVPATAEAGAAIAAALLVAFTGVLVRALRVADGAACNCFGASTSAVAPRHVVRNVLLLGAALLAAASPADPPHASLRAVGWALAVAITAAVPVVLLDEFADVLRPAKEGVRP